ncbi:MAG: type IV pilin [Nanoarchaeota archaeon]|nr:type IV pilin [Nanoarchaeota archaeon]
MKKGISPIIATIMLLMITVALMSLFWAFSSGLFGSVTSGVSAQTDASIKRAGSEFTIINAKNTSLTNINVTIRNSGTQNLDFDTLAAFVDDNAASETASGAVLPGGTSTFAVTSPFSLTRCSHVLRLSAAYASDAYYTIKSNSPLCA